MDELPQITPQDDSLQSTTPNSYANAWNNLVPKKLEPTIDSKILNDEINKKIIWRNFSFKYLIENFQTSPLRFKLVILSLGMILIALLTFLAIAYIGYNATQNLKALDKNTGPLESLTPTNQDSSSPVFPPPLEIKDRESALNGELFTPTDFNNFINKRPYAISVDNAVLARTQMSGLISADIVYEFPTEGYTNRFLAIFWSRKPSIVGPVRSIRTYMMDILPDSDSILNHFGQSSPETNRSYSSLELKAVDAASYFSTNSVDHTECGLNQEKSLLDLGIPSEHTYFSNISALNDCIPAGWVRAPKITNYLFKQDIEASLRPILSEVSVSSNDNLTFSSRWVYNPSQNIYSRYQDNAEHKERELGTITAKNIILQYVKVTGISDSLNHLNISMIGEGKAVILLDGKVINGKWSKPSRDVRTKFYNEAGEEIRFNRGKFWIYEVPSESGSSLQYRISYK